MKINETLGSAALLLILIFGVYSFTSRTETKQTADKPITNETTPRTIQVTGSAEMNVQPDEVELEISIHENSESQLKKSEETLYKILEEHNIPKDEVNFNHANNNWYWYYWWSYRNRPILRKQFYVKLHGDTDFLALVQSLNKNWVENVRVHSTNNSRMQTLREEVKIEAIKAAKRKADYLLESIDEDLGKIVSIEEINNQDGSNNVYPYWYHSGRNNFNSNVVSNSVVSYTPSSSGNAEVDNTHTIKLRYQIMATFSIQ